MSIPPSVLENLAALKPLKEKRTRVGIFLDLDGTLCPLVDLPERVRLPRGTRSLLETLAERYRSVVIISGRAASFLERLVGIPSVTYVGNHGLEVIEEGKRRVLLPEDLVRRMRRLEDELRSSINCEGALLELKELSHAIHYRRVRDSARTRECILRELEKLDLEGVRLTEGKLLIQLRPVYPLDKGKAVEMIVEERRLGLVLYAGDDTTDVDAFRSLRDLQARGSVKAFMIAVLHPDAPADLLNMAEFGVDGVEGMRSLLEWLAA